MVQKWPIAQVLSCEKKSFCKEPLVYWKLGSYRGESQFQVGTANHSYSHITLGSKSTLLRGWREGKRRGKRYKPMCLEKERSLKSSARQWTTLSDSKSCRSSECTRQALSPSWKSTGYLTNVSLVQCTIKADIKLWSFFFWTVILHSSALSVCLINSYSLLLQHHPSTLPIITKSSRLKRLWSPNVTCSQEKERQLIL